MTTYWLERAWTGDGPVRDGVLVDVEDGVFTRVASGAPDGAERLAGLTIPGLAELPQPRLPPGAARPHPARSAGTFWTWREQMYDVAARLDPGLLLRAGPGDVPGDGPRSASPASASSTTCTTARTARRTTTRTRCRTRWSRPRARPGCGSPCWTPATSPRGSGRRPRGCRRGSATATRSAGRAGSSALDAGRPAGRPGRRGDPLGARGAARPDVAGRRLGRAARRPRCTCTCPSRSPRTTPAWRRTG